MHLHPGKESGAGPRRRFDAAGPIFTVAGTVEASAVAKDGAWRDALQVVDQEFRRALRFGITRAELDEVLTNWRSGLRNEVASAATRRSEALANALVSTADGDSVFTTPAWRLRLFERVAPTLTPATTLAALRAAVEGASAPLIRVTSKRALDSAETSREGDRATASAIAPGSDAALILPAYAAAEKLEVSPPADSQVAKFAYPDWGAPGRVVTDDRVADLGIRRIRFANNVMLNIKRTEFQRGVVRMQLRVDGGDLLKPKVDPARIELTSFLPLGGTEAHSFDEMRSIFAGHTVSPTFGSQGESFGAAVVTRPADLELQADVLLALMLHPGYGPRRLRCFAGSCRPSTPRATPRRMGLSAGTSVTF